MNEDWTGCKNVLIIRADNMGDLLMSTPAIRAVKETLGCKISVLTSSMGASIANLIAEIDDVIICDLPWVKTNVNLSTIDYFKLIADLKKRDFDGAVIFTVYSQNPLPSVMLAYLAEIPHRLAYCRENPYLLLTTWVAEKEPYTFVRHQVRRDLDLVAQINCLTSNEHLSLQTSDLRWKDILTIFTQIGVDPTKPLIILHAGVSEIKREYSFERWVETGNLLKQNFKCQLLLTGSSSEKNLTDKLSLAIGENSFSLAGMLNLEEFITLIKHVSLVISVNTSTIHIAAATETPILVLYALTNPQHTPWKAKGEILPFNIPKSLQSKNEVVKYVNEHLFHHELSSPSPINILESAKRILMKSSVEYTPELIVSFPAELKTIGKFSWLPASD